MRKAILLLMATLLVANVMLPSVALATEPIDQSTGQSTDDVGIPTDPASVPPINQGSAPPTNPGGVPPSDDDVVRPTDPASVPPINQGSAPPTNPGGGSPDADPDQPDEWIVIDCLAGYKAVPSPYYRPGEPAPECVPVDENPEDRIIIECAPGYELVKGKDPSGREDKCVPKEPSGDETQGKANDNATTEDGDTTPSSEVAGIVDFLLQPTNVGLTPLAFQPPCDPLTAFCPSDQPSTAWSLGGTNQAMAGVIGGLVGGTVGGAIGGSLCAAPMIAGVPTAPAVPWCVTAGAAIGAAVGGVLGVLIYDNAGVIWDSVEDAGSWVKDKASWVADKAGDAWDEVKSWSPW